MKLTPRQIKNFWNKVEKTETCWNWTAYTSAGYGKLGVNGIICFAHKISMVIVGKLDKAVKSDKGSKGMVVMHRCDNKKCVNPKHLAIATQKENMSDAKNKGRMADTSGENNPRAKLTWEKVNKIKSLFGSLSQKKIAAMFGVNESQIYCIKLGKTWRTN